MNVLKATVSLVTLALLTFSQAEATLSKSDKKKISKIPKQAEPSLDNVYIRGLVSELVKASDIVKEHSSYCDVEREVKKFDGMTLGYVTPWNSHGYDVAKLFSHKFSFIAPVWFQMQRRGVGLYEIKGKQDIDSTWMTEVSKSGNALIVPRVLFGDWHLSDFQQLFSAEKEIEACVESLVDLILKKKFDGVVIEIWSQLIIRFKEQALHFIGHLSHSLKEFDKSLILVLPPPLIRGGVKSNLVTRADFEKVAPLVDAISLMTYDFSEPNRPGPNSPINWIQSCVELLEPNIHSVHRRKILLGLNFYGYQYSTHPRNGAVTGDQYVQFLANHKPKLQWDEKSAEHFVKYKSKSEEILMYYPTLKSIDIRIQLARKLGVGVSIWELGQGLDYFYDLI